MVFYFWHFPSPDVETLGEAEVSMRTDMGASLIAFLMRVGGPSRTITP